MAGYQLNSSYVWVGAFRSCLVSLVHLRVVIKLQNPTTTKNPKKKPVYAKPTGTATTSHELMILNG